MKVGRRESALQTADTLINNKDTTLPKLGAQKKEANAVIQTLTTALEDLQKQKDVEIEELRDQMVDLNEKVDSLLDENAKLRTGEGIDMEVIIDTPGFTDIKRFDGR